MNASWQKEIFKVPKSGVWRTVWLTIAVTAGMPFAWKIVEVYKGLVMGYIPRITDYIAFISIPVLFVLWLFRTHDVREQIEKTQENINSGLYNKGVESLGSENGINRRNGLLIMSIVRRRGSFEKEIDIITSAKLNLEDGAYLIKSNLAEMNLSSANLRRAYLMSANLKNTKLTKTYLYGAFLQGANLQNAKLQNANLQHASLQNANLQNAKLQGTDLRNTNLTSAILENAIYNNETQFPKEFNPEDHGMIKEK